MGTSLKIQDLSTTGTMITSLKKQVSTKVLPINLLVEIRDTLENAEIELFEDTAIVLTDDSELVIDATVHMNKDSEDIYVFKNDEELELTNKQAEFIINFLKGYHNYHFSGVVDKSNCYDMYDYNGVKPIDFV